MTTQNIALANPGNVKESQGKSEIFKMPLLNAEAYLPNHNWNTYPAEDGKSGMRYARTIGGEGTGIKPFSMVISGHEGKWEPWADGVKFPSVNTKVEAANLLIQHWNDLPIEQKLQEQSNANESHGNALKGELMVYAVAVESESSGKVDWYWDRGDSEAAFEAAKKEFADCPGEKITHFKLELPHAMCADEITNLVDDAMHEGEYETLAIHEMKSLDNALAAADDSATLMVSLDGGQTFIPAPSGVRLIYKNVLVPAEEELGELHINATSEGLISDLWVSRDEELDHNLGTKSQLIDDLVEQLVDDPVIDDSPSMGM